MSARMPHVTWDSQKNRAVYQRRFPKDVSVLTGNWYRHKYPRALSLAAARTISHEQAAEFTARVNKAIQRLDDPETRAEALCEGLEQAMEKSRPQRARYRAHFTAGMAVLHQALARMDSAIERRQRMTALYRAAALAGVEIEIANETRKRADPREVLRLWQEKRAESSAVRRSDRRSKIRELSG